MDNKQLSHCTVYTKVPKAEVFYILKAEYTEHCGDCKFFEQEKAHHCSRVEGEISPKAYCDLFERKEKK